MSHNWDFEGVVVQKVLPILEVYKYNINDINISKFPEGGVILI